jgi:hypothetical protein
MAKVKGGGTSHKLSFGKRKKGKAKKSFNKHDRKSRVYRGQGKA